MALQLDSPIKAKELPEPGDSKWTFRVKLPLAQTQWALKSVFFFADSQEWKL